jgi:hypothetical protein
MGWHFQGPNYRLTNVHIPPNAMGIFRHRLTLAHDLQLILRGPADLCEAQAALDTLQIFSSDLVTQNVRLLVALVQLLSRGSLVNTHHGHTDGPGSITMLVTISICAGKWD